MHLKVYLLLLYIYILKDYLFKRNIRTVFSPQVIFFPSNFIKKITTYIHRQINKNKNCQNFKSKSPKHHLKIKKKTSSFVNFFSLTEQPIFFSKIKKGNSTIFLRLLFGDKK